jgi:hypothetical protein
MLLDKMMRSWCLASDEIPKKRVWARMDNAILLNLLDQFCCLPREQATVEFKSSWDFPQDFSEYLSAMANSAILEQQA